MFFFYLLLLNTISLTSQKITLAPLFITYFSKHGLYFTLRQTGLVKTRAAGPILPALRNEIIVWSYLNTGCQSSKNLIKFKIVQYVKDNELILNISLDMCTLFLDIVQLIIYNVAICHFYFLPT